MGAWKSAELAADVRAGLASGSPRGVPDRRYGLLLGAALVRVPLAVDGPVRLAFERDPALLLRAVSDVPDLAERESEVDADALRPYRVPVTRTQGDVAP